MSTIQLHTPIFFKAKNKIEAYSYIIYIIHVYKCDCTDLLMAVAEHFVKVHNLPLIPFEAFLGFWLVKRTEGHLCMWCHQI